MAIECNLQTMNRLELRDALSSPQLWLGWSALDIKRSVIKAGGWRWIFAQDLPKWAHFARQMFNEEPGSLMRVSDQTAERDIENALWSRALNNGKKNHIVAKFAYSGDVYQELTTDKYGKTQWRSWIEQSQAGTRYHYKKGQEMGDFKHTVYSAVTTHSSTDAFKLCLPDGTGGSNEACFYNKEERRSLADWGDSLTNVRQKAIKDNRYRGSYNYADTMAIGYDLHEKFDVDPDNEWGQDYVDEKQFSPQSDRIFEPKHFVGEDL